MNTNLQIKKKTTDGMINSCQDSKKKEEKNFVFTREIHLN
jgi:hypothetical protein